MDRCLTEVTNIDENDESKKKILQLSIANIKCNTRLLICHQLDKIQQLINEKMWLVHHIIATDVFNGDRKQVVDEAWRNTVLQPCLDIDPVFMFKYKYDTCFIWIDVEQSFLNRRVDMRVDQMVNAGEIEPDSDFTAEAFCLQTIVYIEIFLKTQCVSIIVGGSNSYIENLYKTLCSCSNRNADYTKGIRWSIGVPEMDRYLREETNIDEDDESKKMILQSSIANIKRNTRLLICHQLDKIQQLINEKMWLVHHIIAIDIFKGDRKEVVDEAWRNTIFQSCLDILKRFLKNDDHNIIIE
ncbi:hypothetical protein H5410_020925 [Solanum commersonii]|uniref:Uncharacterized protein n=1 Tax=Solanum commersonii TaxID=4109 RepID=A0A9J5ZDP1_SOLCO|nr:hypothetical protein H5410_020925 [Solanum commersonii]